MLSQHNQPIVAIATASGRGAVGIVRATGKSLGAWVEHLLGRVLLKRQATYLSFNDRAGVPIDHGLALFFPAPHSYTGEDVLELQAHGGPVVLQLLLARCLEAAAELDPATGLAYLSNMRMARPGEFTERAFLNEKMDLAQAEAVADLIDASTEAAARGASQSLSGAFSREVHGLRDALIHLRMLVEATLDFPEEEIDFLDRADANGQLAGLRQALQDLLQCASQGALLRDGMTVVIAGQPNAGKSSLLNALAGAELAIVTPIAGTTRDKIQQTIQIEGVPVHVIDTAGLRPSDDAVEQMGIARTWDAIATADAIVFLHDLTRATATDCIAADVVIARAIVEKRSNEVRLIHVWNKADLVADAVAESGVALSAKTGLGVDSLRRLLLEAAGWQATGSGTFIARERHIQALRSVNGHLVQATMHLGVRDQALDLLAEELRLAQQALSEITGEFSSDDLLGTIFSKFCIGK
jgi:tRNA modification GTPase